MYQVCEIRKLTGGRFLICLDSGELFPLYGKEIAQYSICENREIPERIYTKIMYELLPKRAKLCAMHYLEKSDRTEHQLRRKLVELSYPEAAIEQAIDYMRQFHYIDDVRYASNYISWRSAGRSRLQLERELMEKGIHRDILQMAFEKAELPDEAAQLQLWLEKKHYQDVCGDQKEKERIYRFLLRKGYEASAILRAMQIDES